MTDSTTQRHWTPPTRIAWLCFIVVTLILFSLSAWQLKRLAWKESIVNTVAQYQTTKALSKLPLEDNIIQTMPYARVALSGEYQHKHEIHLSPRYYNSQLGYHILTPFKLTDGRTILVNRGWVHVDKKDPVARMDGQLEGVQHIIGMIRTDVSRHSFTPDNDEAENIWFWKDYDAINKVTSLNMPHYLIDALYTTDDEALPRASDGLVALRNDHLSYAITWAAIAIAGIVIFILFHYQPATTSNTKT